MDTTGERLHDTDDGPPRQSEARLRAMLEQSQLDISEGRVMALQPVLDAMRTEAEAIRLARGAAALSDRHSV